jgi:hypothetical protein
MYALMILSDTGVIIPYQDMQADTLTECARLVYHQPELCLRALSQQRVEQQNLMCHPQGNRQETLLITCQCGQ